MYINCLQLQAKPVLVVVSICLLLTTARTSDSLDGAATQTDNDTALCRRDPLVARSGVRARHKHASAFAAAKVQPHQLDEWQNTKLHQQDSLTGLYVRAGAGLGYGQRLRQEQQKPRWTEPGC